MGRPLDRPEPAAETGPAVRLHRVSRRRRTWRFWLMAACVSAVAAAATLWVVGSVLQRYHDSMHRQSQAAYELAAGQPVRMRVLPRVEPGDEAAARLAETAAAARDTPSAWDRLPPPDTIDYSPLLWLDHLHAAAHQADAAHDDRVLRWLRDAFVAEAQVDLSSYARIPPAARRRIERYRFDYTAAVLRALDRGGLAEAVRIQNTRGVPDSEVLRLHRQLLERIADHHAADSGPSTGRP